MLTNRQRNHIDVPTLTAVLVLMVLSLGVVYSASASWAYEKFGTSSRLLNSHLIKVLLGIGAMFVGMMLPYKIYQRLTKPALIAALVFLGITLVLGGEMKGATRWLHFGGMSFQPSEFAKFALLFHLCALVSTKQELMKDFKRGFIPVMIWVGLVSVFVLAQPNFSAGVMILALSIVVLYVGCARLSHLFLAAAAMLPVIAVYVLMAPYRRERIMMFLDGHSNGKPNYQLLQGIIGFGNGGLFGVGPGESRQRDFFLPESYGDFVFSIVGEEYGLIGTVLFMGLFLFIMLRGFRIAKYAQDDFGRLLALAITSTVTLYALVNASVALGILPTTGQPMPFVSYGGSSLIFSSFAIGVLLNISAFTDMHPREQKHGGQLSEAATRAAASDFGETSARPRPEGFVELSRDARPEGSVEPLNRAAGRQAGVGTVY
ncbi:MAG: cell division protein FtsW [Ignavibacteriales bacterium]|nr:cell division protein FtsW [Ignavibacteriales bacterium]